MIDSATLSSLSPEDLNILLLALVSTISILSKGNPIGSSPSNQFLHKLVLQMVHSSSSSSSYWDYWTQIPIKEGSCASDTGNHILNLLLSLRTFAMNDQPLAESFDRSLLQVNVAANDPQEVYSMKCRETCVEDVFRQARFVSLGRFYGYKAVLVSLSLRFFQFLKKDSDLFVLAVSLLGVEPYRGRVWKQANHKRVRSLLLLARFDSMQFEDSFEIRSSSNRRVRLGRSFRFRFGLFVEFFSSRRGSVATPREVLSARHSAVPLQRETPPRSPLFDSIRERASDARAHRREERLF